MLAGVPASPPALALAGIALPVHGANAASIAAPDFHTVSERWFSELAAVYPDDPFVVYWGEARRVTVVQKYRAGFGPPTAWRMDRNVLWAMLRDGAICENRPIVAA